MWKHTEMSAEDVVLQRSRYEPLTDSIRELIDAALRTDADDDVVALARTEVDRATAGLRRHQRDGTCGFSVTPEGDSVSWGDLVTGLRNPLAPRLVVQRDTPTRAHLDVDLGAAYEGAPGHVHGGYCALVLDHILGDVASRGSAGTIAATGTISVRYHRPTRLGSLRVEGEVQRTDGRKIFVAGHIADADGITVTADGLYIALRQ
jgi:acyl-coenzyme A thioesterase PaaI-like protein